VPARTTANYRGSVAAVEKTARCWPEAASGIRLHACIVSMGMGRLASALGARTNFYLRVFAISKAPRAPAPSLFAPGLRLSSGPAIVRRLPPLGSTESLLMAHGFGIETLRELVRGGLATAERRTVRAGKRRIEVTPIEVTAAGRRAVAE
jgi:hypothetical protein